MHGKLHNIASVKISVFVIAMSIMVSGNAMGSSCSVDYANITTAPAYILVNLVGSKSNERELFVLKNPVFARFIADMLKVSFNSNEFISDVYVPYMEKRHLKPLKYSVEDLKSFLLEKHLKDKEQLNIFLRVAHYESANFSDFSVTSTSDLFLKYFQPHKSIFMLKASHQSLQSNAQFIGLLIKMGFSVTMGDIVPTLFVRRCR